VLLGLEADDRRQRDGYFPYTPATNMLYALDQALDMLAEEGLQNVFAAMTAMPRRRGGACGPGAWRSNATSRGTIPPR
jgi:aspartate aminotransferase-like enzyme